MENLPGPGELAALRKEVRFLLKQLSEFKKSSDSGISKRAEKLECWYRAPVKAAVRDLRPAENRLFWVLSSGRTRKRACASCCYLYDVLYVGLGPEVNKLSE